MNTRRGFTIVELAIVIFILSVLLGVSLVVSQRTQISARDSQRQSDILTLKLALSHYFADNNEYPIAQGFATGTGYAVNSGVLAAIVPNYVSVIPTAPNGTNYQYVRATATDSYGLYVVRESGGACKTGEKISSAWWGTDTPTCPY